MAYPPSVPPATRTDSTATVGTHADDHNQLASALTAIIAELGADPSGTAASLTARLLTLATSSSVAAKVDRWTANTTYTAGQIVVSPGGNIIQAIAGFTSGATYDATKWVIVTGSSSLALGTTSTTAKRGDYAPTLADVPPGSLLVAPLNGSINTNAAMARPSNRTDIFFRWRSTVQPNNMVIGDEWYQAP